MMADSREALFVGFVFPFRSFSWIRLRLHKAHEKISRNARKRRGVENPTKMHIGPNIGSWNAVCHIGNSGEAVFDNVTAGGLR